MKYESNENLYKELSIDCSNCFGFCCVALYFSKMDGFPEDKKAGQPCINLSDDFSCKIHSDLRKIGLKGCTSFDCLGAGQKVAQKTYKNISWREAKEKAQEMYDVFLVMKNTHEMMYYLNDSMNFTENKSILKKIEDMIEKISNITNLSPKYLLKIDIEKQRIEVNNLLKEVRRDFILKTNLKNKKDLPLGFDFIGKNLSNKNLKNQNLAGALLIGANMKELDLSGTMVIGADMRDADLRGANLKNTMYLTQSQINTAKGNSKTKLPQNIKRPFYWEK